MSRRRTTLEMGHDAFLDIVANLVGILIILVVVLGSQSHSTMEETVDAAKVELSTDQQMSTLAQYASQAASAQSDSNRFEARIKQMDAEIEHRKRQRGAMMDLVAKAQEAWNQTKAETDNNTVLLAEQNRKLKEATEELAKLRGQSQNLENQKEPIATLTHLPTPMAKTVFGEEVHFRLKDNRLSVVPIKQLLNEIRRDFSRMASSRRNGSMDAVVGPMRGYIANYQARKSREVVSSGSSVGTGVRLELVRMSVQPMSEPHGQPVGDVIRNPQILDVELAGLSLIHI